MAVHRLLLNPNYNFSGNTCLSETRNNGQQSKDNFNPDFKPSWKNL